MAMPTAQARPWPREPVEMSMPGHLFMLGWPWRGEPSLRRVSRTSMGKKPFMASAAYCAGQTWPFERTKRSRSAQRGFFGSTFI